MYWLDRILYFLFVVYKVNNNNNNNNKNNKWGLSQLLFARDTYNQSTSSFPSLLGYIVLFPVLSEQLRRSPITFPGQSKRMRPMSRELQNVITKLVHSSTLLLQQLFILMQSNFT